MRIDTHGDACVRKRSKSPMFMLPQPDAKSQPKLAL